MGVVGGKQGGYQFTANKRPSVVSAGGVSMVKQPDPVKPPTIDTSEVKTKALERRNSLAEKVAAQAAMMKTLGTKIPGMDREVANEMAYVPPKRGDSEGIADTTDAMWARMKDDNMSPAQQAELNHIRCMITSLTQSLEGYKKAEKELMLQAMRAPKNK